jgi:hypothetical protein
VKLFLAILFVLAILVSRTASSQPYNASSVDTCACKPSLPIEIAATSIIWGIPTYWIWRSGFDRDSSGYKPTGILIIPSLFLLMPVLGFTAEWTSGCEASHWHTLWIGLVTGATAFVLYGAFYGFSHSQITNEFYRFNLIDYLALGVVPSVASTLIFNLFLHCPEKKGDQSMLIYPTVGLDKTASLNVMLKF